MSILRCHITLLLSVTIFQQNSVETAGCNGIKSEEFKKFQHCHLRHDRMELNCDCTKFVDVPLPGDNEKIKSQVDANLTEILHFSSNCLTTIDKGTLTQYPLLTSLCFDDNKIRKIPKQAFVGNPKLRILILSRNQISRIEFDAFKGLTRLETLKLENNRLLQIGKNGFSFLPTLNILNLSNNSIKTIKKNAFKNFPNLTELNLEGNNLQEITTMDLKDMKNLSDINLSRNNITVLSDELFTSNLKISKVDISHNNIACIPSQIFSQNRFISDFHIEGNRLEIPRPSWFRQIARGKEPKRLSKLGENNWRCDCSSINYFIFLTEAVDVKWKPALNLECSSPVNYKGVYIGNLRKSHFDNCNISDLVVEKCDEKVNRTATFIPGKTSIRASTSIRTTTTPSFLYSPSPNISTHLNIRYSIIVITIVAVFVAFLTFILVCVLRKSYRCVKVDKYKKSKDVNKNYKVNSNSKQHVINQGKNQICNNRLRHISNDLDRNHSNNFEENFTQLDSQRLPLCGQNFPRNFSKIPSFSPIQSIPSTQLLGYVTLPKQIFNSQTVPFSLVEKNQFSYNENETLVKHLYSGSQHHSLPLLTESRDGAIIADHSALQFQPAS